MQSWIIVTTSPFLFLFSDIAKLAYFLQGGKMIWAQDTEGSSTSLPGTSSRPDDILQDHIPPDNKGHELSDRDVGVDVGRAFKGKLEWPDLVNVQLDLVTLFTRSVRHAHSQLGIAKT